VADRHPLFNSFAKLAIVLSLCLCAESALASVVYDNSTTPVASNPLIADPYCPNGFWRFNVFAANELMGDQIKLAGTDREIVEFHLILSSTQPTSLPVLTLAFYSKGGTTDAPLWTGSLTNVAVDGLTEVIFQVPNVVVPTSFVWLAGADSELAGLAVFNPPTVGSSGDYYWDLDNTGHWWGCYFEGDPVANFGATIIAVPEPATLGLLSIGCLLLGLKKRSSR
jgi:hypothetical protein